MPARVQKRSAIAQAADDQLGPLFWRDAGQRLLSLLAYYGPMRRQQARDLSRYEYGAGIAQLQQSGLVVAWVGPNPNKKFLALNPAHPAIRELRAMLRLLLPPECEGAEFERPDREAMQSIPRYKAPPAQLERLFGWPNRTRFILTIELRRGKIAREALALELSDLSSQVFRKYIQAFKERGVLRETADKVISFDPSYPHLKPLRALLRRMLSVLPAYRKRKIGVKRRVQKETYRAANGPLRWLDGVIGAQRPTAFVPSILGTPLLFGTDARYRALAALAVIGPMRMMKWSGLVRFRGPVAIRQLEASDFVVMYGTARKRFIALNPAFPAYDQLVALLVRLHEHYPAFESRLAPSERYEYAGPIRARWYGEIERFAILRARSKVLLSVAALEYGVDQSSLKRLFPEHAHGETAHALHMFEAQGVFKMRKEGSANLYALSRTFCAHAELRKFLTKILDVWPQFRTRVKNEERYMPPARMRMRHNAKKRSRKSRASK